MFLRYSARGGLLACITALVLAATPAVGQHAIDGNIFWNNTTLCSSSGTVPTGCDYMNVLFTHNDVVDPQLTAPNAVWPARPSFQPLLTSPALAMNDDVVNPIIYGRECEQYQTCDLPEWARVLPVCFRGAIPAVPFYEGYDWTEGNWVSNNPNGAGRTDIDYNKNLVTLQGEYASDLLLTNNNNYLVRGRVRIMPPATLTIQAGTVLFGEKATVGFLVIERGAKIDAQGTRNNPILLTSDQAPGSMAPSDNGGLVVNGYAMANCAECWNGASCISEGTAVEHCGTNDCDNSGIIRFMRIEFAGLTVAPNNELNTFTFNSVGVNTRLEYLCALRGSDDLFEWFGGKCTAKYLVGIDGGDDGLDWQMGYRGTIQFAVIQQLGNGSDKGIEADNNEYDYNRPCRSKPLIANVTLVAVGTGSSTHGIHLRRGTDSMIYNSIIMGWPGMGLRVEHQATADRGAHPDPGVFCDAASVDGEQSAGELEVRMMPNPFSNSAHFFFNLPGAGPTSLRIFDAQGREVANLVDRDLNAGPHQTVWNLRANQASGTYFYRMENAGRVLTGRMVAVR